VVHKTEADKAARLFFGMESMPRDVVITSVSGYATEQLTPWLNSLDQSGFDGERLVVVANVTGATVDALQARGCRTFSRDTLLADAGAATAPYRDDDISIDRFLLFWSLLRRFTPAEVRYVISVDSRDAVFQQNPGRWLEDNLRGHRLVVSTERLTYGDQGWNRDNLESTFGQPLLTAMRDRTVWNCGTIGGEFSLFRDLALNIYLCCAARGVTYADQTALNILLSLEPLRTSVLFDHGDLGWACSAGTSAARRDETALRMSGATPLFDGEAVHTHDGVPFCIVHQYDRIPLWKSRLEQRFA